MKAPPPTEQELATSLLRDFFAAMALAGRCVTDAEIDPAGIAKHSFEVADSMLRRSKTPDIIAKLKTEK